MAIALQIQTQTTQFPPTWANVNTTTLGIGNASLKFAYGQPAELSFTVSAAQNSLPFQKYATFIRAWDDTGSLGGNPQSASNPLFEGWCEDIQPSGDTNEVQVVFHTPDYRVSRKVVCMSSPWVENPTDDALFPVPDVGAYPRVVYNATTDNDPDWALSLELQASLGKLIQSVLDHQSLPLYHCNAAPGDGSATGVSTPYEADDLGSEESSSSGTSWAGRLSFVPQEKVVSQSESPRSLIERLLSTWAPEFKVRWEPGTRLWRVDKITSASPVTLTWNDPGVTYPMLSMEIHRSVDNCHGAMTFYGPEGIEWRTYIWTNPSDVESSVGDTPPSNTLESFGAGSISDPVGNVVTAHRRFIVTDPDFTRMAARATTPVFVPDIYTMIVGDGTNELTLEVPGSLVQVFGPQVLVRYKPGPGGGGEWHTKRGWKPDFRQGIVDFGDQVHLCRVKPGQQPYLQEPYQVQLITPVLTQPIKVRYPTTGLVGTAAAAGLGMEKHEYDEALAVGMVYRTPVTTSTRLSRFRTLAQQVVNQRKDIIHTGSVLLDGMDYSWARLNKRVNIAAKNDNGGVLVTGWESILAWVTDVEYDFGEQTTSITLSSDQAEIIGLDIESLKARLKIRPAEKQFFYTWSAIAANRMVDGMLGQDVTLRVDVGEKWIDELGEEQ